MWTCYPIELNFEIWFCIGFLKTKITQNFNIYGTRSKNYKLTSINPTHWALSNNTKTWPNLISIKFSVLILLNFQWENYSSLNNSWIGGLNIKRPHRWTCIHQGLSNGTKCTMKGWGWGVVTWEISTWQQNKQTTFMDDRLVHSFTLVLKFWTLPEIEVCAPKRE